jgi:hypothetical protein
VVDFRQITTSLEVAALTADFAAVTERSVPNRGVTNRNKLNMTLKEILSDPSISSWLKDAVKTAYEQDPVDALSDAHRLLKILGERYTQIVNRDLAH